MLRRASEIQGFVLRARDGEIGSVKDLFFDDSRWTVRYLVAKTGTWLHSRQVLLSPHSVRRLDTRGKAVDLDLTREQIEQSPSVDVDKPVSRQFEEDYHRYYNYPFYWQGAGMWGPLPRPGTSYGQVTAPPWADPKSAKRSEPSGDPHLRSIVGVTRYHLEALDGGIGHIEDFIVNDEDWAIEYLVVDTVNWWPGKKVLVPPSWASEVNWQQSTIFLNLDRASIKGAPEYDSHREITRDYESQLFNYYNREPYWTRRAA